MAGSHRGQAIPTQLSLALFEQFVLPHLSVGSRGPAPKLSLFKIFNYILHLLYLGCQWKELPIDKDGEGRPEIHYTRIYSTWRRWEADGCIDAIFEATGCGFWAELIEMCRMLNMQCEMEHSKAEDGPFRAAFGVERTSKSAARLHQN